MGALLEPAVLNAHVAANMLVFRRLRFIKQLHNIQILCFPCFPPPHILFGWSSVCILTVSEVHQGSLANELRPTAS